MLCYKKDSLNPKSSWASKNSYFGMQGFLFFLSIIVRPHAPPLLVHTQVVGSSLIVTSNYTQLEALALNNNNTGCCWPPY